MNKYLKEIRERVSKDLKEIDFMARVSKQELKLTCKDCENSGHKESEEWITCQVHLQNFRHNSLCADFEQKQIKQP